MSRIEELADDFNEQIDLDEAPEMAPTPIEAAYNKHVAAQMPGSGKSFEEIMAEMSKTPLFMDNLDVAATEGTVPPCNTTD